MPALREPDLGPIVGHTTDTSCRLWIRGGETRDPDRQNAPDRRSIGVIAVHELPKKFQDAPPDEMDLKKLRRDMRQSPGRLKPFYFRLHREYDRTGAFLYGEDHDLTGAKSPALKPATRYLALLGVLFLDDPFADEANLGDDHVAARLPDAKVWAKDLANLDPGISTACFRTYPQAGQKQDLNFLLGSCRYPGLLWKIKEADMIFGPVRDEALGQTERKATDSTPPVTTDPCDFVLMVGDQIYADMYNRHVPVGLADTFEEFQERYHTAFGSPNMRTLLKRVPHYMILDDHEIEDNWTQDRLKKAASRKVFHLAIGAYMSYQWSHSPRTFQTRLYYAYECKGYPFFVLDTRTQRFMDDVPDKLEDNHMLGRPALKGEEPGQLERLLEWLKWAQTAHGDAPKFIVSSSVFAPSPMDAREGRDGSPEQQVKRKQGSDSWPAFPTTRKAVLSTIIDNGVQNVVFLSGDIHCANVATIDFSGTKAAERLKAFSITSSAFYWPFPFADGEPSSYVHDSRAPDQKDTFRIDDRHEMNYRAGGFTQEDNFCRIELDPKKHVLRVAAIDKHGKIIRKSTGFFGMRDGDQIINDLQLAPW